MRAAEPNDSSDPFGGKLQLLPLRCPGLVRCYQRLGDFLEIAVAILESFGELADQARRRGVGDEVGRKLLGNVLRRGRMACQIGEHGTALLDADIGIAFAEHHLIARLMQTFDKGELTAVLGLGRVDPRPSGQHIGKARHIGLRIAAANSQCVEFERLARQIFVEALVAVDAGNRIRAHRLNIVEIEQHRRMAFDRKQQVGEAAKHMRADRLTFEGAGHADDLVGGDAKVVRPEPHQPLDKADIGRGRGTETGFGLAEQELLR
ncbi:MAG: hypothetical protein WBF47_12405 [Xanthobacteraceae bacterium]